MQETDAERNLWLGWLLFCKLSFLLQMEEPQVQNYQF